MSNEPKKRTGRPSSFKPEYCQQAAEHCIRGATDAELAAAFGVAVSTIYKWKHDYPEFSEALKAGKEHADERVVRSLYHKAVGYTFDSVHFSSFQGEVTATPYQEHVPPDTTAAIFWLKNRQPELWREKSEQVVRHERLLELSDDELARIATGRSEGTDPAPQPSKLTH